MLLRDVFLCNISDVQACLWCFRFASDCFVHELGVYSREEIEPDVRPFEDLYA